jgi:hypothetical protein
MLTLQEFSAFSERGQNRIIKEYGIVLGSKLCTLKLFSIIKIYDFYILGSKGIKEENFRNFFPLQKTKEWMWALQINLN